LFLVEGAATPGENPDGLPSPLCLRDLAQT